MFEFSYSTEFQGVFYNIFDNLGFFIFIDKSCQNTGIFLSCQFREKAQSRFKDTSHDSSSQYLS